MEINWQSFDWQSFATLVTGALAVGGAVFVGLKQTGISRRQNAILERQASLAEMSLRNDLFDRRYRIYAAARDFLGETFRHADKPEHATVVGFISAMHEARILFDPRVHEGLKAIYDHATAYFVQRSAEEYLYKTTGDYGEGNPEKSGQMLLRLGRDLEGLIELFGDEMKLSQG